MAFEEIAAFTPDIIVGGPLPRFFFSRQRDESLGRADLTVAFSRIVSKLATLFHYGKCQQSY
jgi:hypothetical protein